MPTPNDRPPPGRMMNPAVITACRKRGWPMTTAALADAAKLEGIDLHVPASDAAAQAGLAAITAHQRQAADRAAAAATTSKLLKDHS
jgi:hypothetical protein